MPCQPVLRSQIQKAVEALIGKRCPIIENVTARGFSDQGDSSKHFRMRTGLTPRQFRIRNQS